MNPVAIRNYVRLGTQLLAIGTVIRQLRNAHQDRDGLLFIDAAANALALATALIIIAREMGSRDDAARGTRL